LAYSTPVSFPEDERTVKPVVWIGSSKDDISELPIEVKLVFGQALYLAQIGRKHPDAKPLTGIEGGVLEVAEDLSLRLRHWAPQPGEEPILPGADLKSANGTRVALLDHLPDGSRYLVGVSRDSASSWRVIDGDGRTISDLRARGITFQPTSLSGDGRMVAGFVGHWQGERGWSDTAEGKDGPWTENREVCLPRRKTPEA